MRRTTRREGIPPLAVSVAVYATRCAAGGSEVLVTTRGACWTVRVVEPVMPLRVAEMVVEPITAPVASPVPLTVAAVVFEEDQLAWDVTATLLPSE